MDSDRTTSRVLLVDDDPGFVARATSILATVADFRAVSDADSALEMNRSWRPDLIIFDSLFGAGDTFSLLDMLRYSRVGDRFGVVCLARGRGALNHIELSGDGLFGMLHRELDDDVLRDEVLKAVRATDRLVLQAA